MGLLALNLGFCCFYASLKEEAGYGDQEDTEQQCRRVKQ